MQPITPRESGWPRWVLWATLPVAFAAGFVGGMALGHYSTPTPLPIADAGAPAQQPPPDMSAAPEPGGGQTQTPPVAQQPADSSWRIPVLTTPSPPTPVPAVPQPGTGTAQPPAPVGTPQTTPAEPIKVYTGARVTSLAEARVALENEFGYYGRIRFRYQTMTNNSSGTSLVALISVADLEAWQQALRDEPAKLKSWLESVAKRVQSATSKEKVHLAWAVYERRMNRPVGFPESDLVAQEDGSYLVIKPLAATVDHNHSDVVMRELASLNQASGPVAQGSPWATYGPRP